MKNNKVLFALSILLFGCGTTAAQRQVANMKAVTQKAGKELIACRTTIYNESVYDSIRPHLGSPDNKFMPTLAQLADDSIPTKEESELLISYHDDSLPCRREALTKIDSVAPEIASAIADGLVDADEISLQLVKRKISWGKADKKFLQALGKMRQNVMTASHEVDRRLAASNQAELAQRQATTNSVLQFSGALMQWSVDMAAIKAANQPVYTNCTEGGPYINCVSSSR